MSYPILTPLPIHYRRAMIFDVETTGLIAKPNPAKAIPPRLDECPYIIQLSYVVFDLKTTRVIEAYDAYISIPEEIPIIERITEITGITREIIREKGKPIIPALEAFYAAYMKCDVVVAHNIEFDSSIIAIEIARNADAISTSESAHMSALFTPELNTQYNIDLYCTMKSTIELCSIMAEYPAKPLTVFGPDQDGNLVHHSVPQKTRKYKKFPRLSELHKVLFGTEPANLHNSIIDVMVCLRCFLKIRCCKDVHDMIFDRMLRNVVKLTNNPVFDSVK